MIVFIFVNGKGKTRKGGIPLLVKQLELMTSGYAGQLGYSGDSAEGFQSALSKAVQYF